MGCGILPAFERQPSVQEAGISISIPTCDMAPSEPGDTWPNVAIEVTELSRLSPQFRSIWLLAVVNLITSENHLIPVDAENWESAVGYAAAGYALRIVPQHGPPEMIAAGSDLTEIFIAALRTAVNIAGNPLSVDPVDLHLFPESEARLGEICAEMRRRTSPYKGSTKVRAEVRKLQSCGRLGFVCRPRPPLIKAWSNSFEISRLPEAVKTWNYEITDRKVEQRDLWLDQERQVIRSHEEFEKTVPRELQPKARYQTAQRICNLRLDIDTSRWRMQHAHELWVLLEELEEAESLCKTIRTEMSAAAGPLSRLKIETEKSKAKKEAKETARKAADSAKKALQRRINDLVELERLNSQQAEQRKCVALEAASKTLRLETIDLKEAMTREILERERLERVRLELENSDRERCRKENLRIERLKCEVREQERVKREKAEEEDRERSREENLRLQRLECERREQERAEREKAETERLARLAGWESVLLEKEAVLGAAYRYEPLPASGKQFRLFKLHAASSNRNLAARSPAELFHTPSSSTGDEERLQARFRDHQDYYDHALVCSLQTFDFESPQCPSFEALSYEWNPELHEIYHGTTVKFGKSKDTIVVERDHVILGSVGIGSNLSNFLRHIRHEEDDIWIWADAICINQGSLAERGHQVNLMGKIYSEAFKVLAWLPLDDSDLHRALEKFCSVSNVSQIGNNDSLDIMEQCFQMSYWTRKWIIQEFVLARTVVLVLGSQEFAMQDLEDTFAELVKTNGDKRIKDFRSSPAAILATHRHARRRGSDSPQTLHELLLLYAKNECSEPMDQVYALYNLVGAHKDHLEVGYEQHPSTWARGILKFLDTQEPASRNLMASFALMLEDIIVHSQPYTFEPLPGDPPIQVTVVAYDRGGLKECQECSTSLYLRKAVRRLHPGISWDLASQGIPPTFSICRKDEVTSIEGLSTRVMGYFEVPDQQIVGLSTTRVRDGDRILQIPDTSFAFIVRVEKIEGDKPPMIRILGRCYVFESLDVKSLRESRSLELPPMWTLTSEQLPPDDGSTPLYNLRLEVADLFQLAHAATNADFPDSATSTSLASADGSFSGGGVSQYRGSTLASSLSIDDQNMANLSLGHGE